MGPLISYLSVLKGMMIKVPDHLQQIQRNPLSHWHQTLKPKRTRMCQSYVSHCVSSLDKYWFTACMASNIHIPSPESREPTVSLLCCSHCLPARQHTLSHGATC